MSAAYPTAQGNTRTLNQWVTPGIKPTSSWILVVFITSESGWELTKCKFENHHIFGLWVLTKGKGIFCSRQNQFCTFLKWDKISLGCADSEKQLENLKCKYLEKWILSVASFIQASKVTYKCTKMPSPLVVSKLAPPFLSGIWENSEASQHLHPHIPARPRRSRVEMAQCLWVHWAEAHSQNSIHPSERLETEIISCAP